MSETDKVIPAKLLWQADELGNLVPVSELFEDVYYSLADGLAESRYVFLEQNHLPERFSSLFERYVALQTDDPSCASSETFSNNFTIAELGFGTGLNILATWQLWQQTKQAICLQDNQHHKPIQTQAMYREFGYQTPRLHLISTEKHPLTIEDLTRSLQSWQDNDPRLIPLITRLLSLYPTLVSGCHRLHLEDDVTLDLWLGDATDSLKKMTNSVYHSTLHVSNQPKIDAWYLDGFAPSCNESLWAEQIFNQVNRLSHVNSTLATFSSAGVVKRGLEAAGFEIKKVKGFGRKRQMLTAKKIADIYTDNFSDLVSEPKLTLPQKDHCSYPKINCYPYRNIAIVGAGVSGLMAAWALAQRGIQVTLIDKSAPLSGASGNPRALLAPKMTPIAHVAEHLHSIGYLYSQRLYSQLDRRNELLFNAADKAPNYFSPSKIFTHTGTLDLLVKSNADVAQISEYPQIMATTLSAKQAQNLSGLQHQNLDKNLYLPQAGLINPKALADTILAHSNIRFIKTEVKQINRCQNSSDDSAGINLQCDSDDLSDDDKGPYDAVVIAAAFDSQSLDARIFEFRRIRGQLSWFEPTKAQLEALPKLPLKYGGYCASFIPSPNDDQLNPVNVGTPSFLLGASFVRNDMDTQIRTSEHQVNCHKLIDAISELKSVFIDNHSVDDHIVEASGREKKQVSSCGWQARVGIRAQTPDYHPLVGQIDDEGLIWTLSGMGSKGYAFAPICAQVLADMMTGQYPPLPSSLIDRLSPHRNSLQKPLPK
ncbi:tRNA (5-methylaminomethyl-2-thiouridine)(34)-methyltransferase MnmD [Psychrobacter sp.]|uniref:tRNA (5-methylaminomethyl-2-thiouridine)(34)-methyltransferase MnmD n=1 Tax=Psychrobacter sp. TaxID=56811 RepID=UPI0025E655EE|nr:tRNA (5-methylaminomethyl-2-thiouridine)(34)-methyltransferase MnmD [Psychrobacter sp.]